MIVLSLFDGISCGLVALKRLGVKVDKYYASEIDKYAISISRYNHPEIIQLGDVNNWEDWNIDFPKIDLLLAGFPCQSWSVSGKQNGDNDKRGQLLWVMLDILNHIKKYNKNIKFLFENVKMKKDFLDYVNNAIGLKGELFDSALLSAQSRKRMYWFNWEAKQPDDKGILLKDIVHEYEEIDCKYALSTNEIGYMKRGNDKWQQAGKCRLDRYVQYKENKSYTVTANICKGVPYNCFFQELDSYKVPFDKTLQILDKEVERGKVGYFRQDSQANRVYYIHNKAVTLCGTAGGGAGKMGQYLFGCITPDRLNKRQNGQRFNEGNKFYTLTKQDRHGVLVDGYIRKLTPIECERLQTLDDGYTKFGLNEKNVIVEISNSQRYKALGNGWTVDIISHILSFM